MSLPNDIPFVPAPPRHQIKKWGSVLIWIQRPRFAPIFHPLFLTEAEGALCSEVRLADWAHQHSKAFYIVFLKVTVVVTWIVLLVLLHSVLVSRILLSHTAYWLCSSNLLRSLLKRWLFLNSQYLNMINKWFWTKQQQQKECESEPCFVLRKWWQWIPTTQHKLNSSVLNRTRHLRLPFSLTPRMKGL